MPQVIHILLKDIRKCEKEGKKDYEYRAESTFRIEKRDLSDGV